MRLGPAGAPLQAESTVQPDNAALPLTVGDLASLVDVSRAGWLGIVETPDGSTGVTLRGFGGATSELTVVNDGNEEKDGNAGFGEGGLNDQLLLANANMAFVSYDQQAGTVGVLPFPSAVRRWNNPDGGITIIALSVGVSTVAWHSTWLSRQF